MRTGQCLCGAVRFELTVEPQMLAFCHCPDCQRLTGGEPVAVAVAPQGSFRLTKGEMRVYWSRADSGNMADRHFCAECGTHIAARLSGGPFVAIRASTFDEPLPLKPQMEIWVSTAQPWAHHPEGAMQFEKNPS